MPIFRSRKSKKRHDPYPRLGTPAGDQSIGPCNGPYCDRKLRRGDIFFCLLSGHTLCIDCYEKAGFDLATAVPSDPPAPVTFEGDVPF